jgi:hypothetical protein
LTQPAFNSSIRSGPNSSDHHIINESSDNVTLRTRQAGSKLIPKGMLMRNRSWAAPSSGSSCRSSGPCASWPTQPCEHSLMRTLLWRPPLIGIMDDPLCFPWHFTRCKFSHIISRGDSPPPPHHHTSSGSNLRRLR